MVAASFGFACMGVCVKLASVRFPTAEIVFWRSVVALAVAALFVRAHGIPFRTPELRLQITRGLVGFVSLMLYFLAIGMLPLATAVTLNYTSPLFFFAFLVAFGGMRLRRAFIPVLLVGLVGVMLLLKPVLSQDLWLGGLLGLGSGICAGMAYFSVRTLGRRGEHEARTVFYFSLVSAGCGGVWVLFAGLSPPDLEGALLLAGVGVFAALAQLAMTRSLRRGRAMVSASLSYTAVIFASLFGILIWNETLDATSLVAIALIVGSGIASARVARSNPAEQD